MTATEAKTYLGKHIKYKCKRSQNSLFPIWNGVVEEIVRSEINISGDWINLKGLEVVEVIGE